MREVVYFLKGVIIKFREIGVVYKLNATLKRTFVYICVPTANILIRWWHTNISECSFSGVCVYTQLLSS